MSNHDRAAKIQQFLDWEFGIDIAQFQNSELARMATEINNFLELGVDTDDLDPADGDTGDYDDEEDFEHDEERGDYADANSDEDLDDYENDSDDEEII